jgi:hypothetical protein
VPMINCSALGAGGDDVGRLLTQMFSLQSVCAQAPSLAGSGG